MAVKKVQRRGRVVWRARVKVGGRTATAFRKRQDEAIEAEAELRLKLKAEAASPPTMDKEVPTLATFAKEFINVYVRNNNEESTGREKRRALHRRLLPDLGELRLDQIGPKQIERFKARRLGDGVSRKTVNEELSILSKLLDYANEIGDLPTAPPRVRRLKTQPPDFDFLDFEEAERLATAAKTAPAPWGTMIPIAMLTGLRLGELRGLKWDDVDLTGGRIHVRRSADDRNVLKSPKSGKSRFVDLPQTAVDLLRQHKHLRGPFVFCREDGRILSRAMCESKSHARKHDSPLMKVCREAGLRRVGWHVLRHTYASHLVMRGASLTEVKELLGHADIRTTMRYAHLSPQAKKAAVQLLDEPAPFGATTGVTKRAGAS